MEKATDWLQTYTGKKFWPLEPAIEDLCIEDIAHALSLQCRYGGHCIHFYSVAEHCVRVSRAVPEEAALWGLMHDASEAYLADVVRPLKRSRFFGEAYAHYEEQLMCLICDWLGLPHEVPPSVKLMDNRLLHTERRDNMRPTGERWNRWNEDAEPLRDWIVPWSTERAEVEFLGRFKELTGAGA